MQPIEQHMGSFSQDCTIYLEIFTVRMFHSYVLCQDFRVLNSRMPLSPGFLYFTFHRSLLLDWKIFVLNHTATKGLG